MLTDQEAVRQGVLQRLRLWLGEWFLDSSAGVPYPTILGYPLDPPLARQMLTRAVRSVEGVESVEDVRLEYTAGNRSLQMSCLVRTIYGPVRLTEETLGLVPAPEEDDS